MIALGTDVKLWEEGTGLSLQKWKRLFEMVSQMDNVCHRYFHLWLVLRDLQKPVVVTKPTPFVLYGYS